MSLKTIKHSISLTHASVITLLTFIYMCSIKANPKLSRPSKNVEHILIISAVYFLADCIICSFDKDDWMFIPHHLLTIAMYYMCMKYNQGGDWLCAFLFLMELSSMFIHIHCLNEDKYETLCYGGYFIIRGIIYPLLIYSFIRSTYNINPKLTKQLYAGYGGLIAILLFSYGFIITRRDKVKKALFSMIT